jgi:hypothetical protein
VIQALNGLSAGFRGPCHTFRTLSHFPQLVIAEVFIADATLLTVDPSESAMHIDQVDAAAHADEAAHNLGADVLLNGLLLAHIWGHLNSYDKRQLCAVARGVRALADGLVVSLKMLGKSASSDLASALARWPNVERLEADCDDNSAAVISAAPLTKLKALVLERWVSAWGVHGAAPCMMLMALSCGTCSMQHAHTHTSVRHRAS